MTPKLIPVLYMPKLHGKDGQCVCRHRLWKGERVWLFECDDGETLLACRGDGDFCKLRLSWKASQLLVDAEELITQGEMV